MRFATPLSLDVLCYCILHRLTGSMGGVNRSRLKEDGVGWALDEHNRDLITAEMEASIEEAKAKIASGEITVHDYRSDNSCPTD